MAAISVAFGYQLRIKAERRIVQEHTPINLSHIDWADPAGSDDPDRVLEVERQPQIPRKVVQGPERQDAQGDVRASEDGSCAAMLPSPPPTTTTSKRRSALSCETASSSLIRSLILLPGTSAIVTARLLALQTASTRSLPRSIPSFARVPLPGFKTTKPLIPGKHKRERRRSLAHFRFKLLRKRVADRAFDLERPLDAGPRHHAFVMSGQAGEVAGAGFSESTKRQ